MFKSHKLTYLAIAGVLAILGVVAMVSAQQGVNISNVTPTANTTWWSPGSNNSVSWNHSPGSFWSNCGYTLGLFALDSSGVPIVRRDNYGRPLYDYPGQVNANSSSSGTINLPPNTPPGQYGRYKVMVDCSTNTGAGFDYSAGTVIIPSNKFTIGDRVVTNLADVSVTSGPPSFIVIGSQSLGAIGTVVAGPYWDEDRFMWGVNFDSGVDGSVSEARLSRPDTVRLSVGVSPTSGGTVQFSPAGQVLPQGHMYERGTVVTMTAVPASGYGFNNWSGYELVSRLPNNSTNPATITMNDTVDGQAVFVPTASINVTQPVNGATYQIGDTININWTVSDVPTGATFRLERFYTNGVSTNRSVDNIANSLRNWTASASLDNGFVAGTPYYYRVSLQNNPAIFGQSGTFRVVEQNPGGGGVTPIPGGGNPNQNPGFTQAPPGWRPPPGTPPACSDPNTPGCWPPLNVSATDQFKNGGLSLNALLVDGGASITGSLKLPFASKGEGKVLMSNSEGEVRWETPGTTPPGDGGGGVDRIVAGSSNISISPASGIGVVTISSTGGDDGPLPSCVSSGQILKWNGSAWDCASDEIGAAGTGDITSVKSSGSKSGITVKSSTIVDGDTVGGEALTGEAIISLRRDCGTNQVLKWDAGWKCANDETGGGPNGGGTVTSVRAGNRGGLETTPVTDTV
ncbi:MAG: hypothetical protein AAB505_01570, partial [Patescibacteria group bacterium]